MTTQVPPQTPENQYIAVAGQTVFDYTFLIFSNQDITVKRNNITLSLNADYSVSDVGVTDGGEVTLVDPVNEGDIITLFRDMQIKRDIDYQESGAFRADTVDNDFNRIILLLQQLNQGNSKALKLSDSDDLTGVNLPLLIPEKSIRASKALGFDATGNPTPINLVSEGTSDAALIAYETPLGFVVSVKEALDGVTYYSLNQYIVAVDNGTADNYQLTNYFQIPFVPVNTYAYTTGATLLFEPTNANLTTSPTVNLENLGNIPLKNKGGVDFQPGEIDPSRGFYTFIKRPAFFELLEVSIEQVDGSDIDDGTVTPEKISLTEGFTLVGNSSNEGSEQLFKKWQTLVPPTQVLSATTEIEITGIPDTADEIVITTWNFESNTQAIINLQAGYGSTPTYLETVGDYIGSSVFVAPNTGDSRDWDTSTSARFVAYSDSFGVASGTITFRRTGGTWTIASNGNLYTGSDRYYNHNGAGIINESSLVGSLSAVRLLPESGNISGGFYSCTYFG